MYSPLKWILFPLAGLYGLIVSIRNYLYDKEFFPIYHPPVPVISVGNITTGGTGKTPMAEYLINFLSQQDCTVAYLSRGYGRKTKGFLWVSTTDGDPDSYGDEALQVAHKFPIIPVAVCENRTIGIQRILAEHDLQYIILDDAFQHRRVHRDLDLVMIDANQLPQKDWLLPVGRLREPLKGLKRANLLIVNKLTRPERIPAIQEQLSRWSKPVAFTVPRFSQISSFWGPQTISTLEGVEVILFSGLGNNEFFLQQVSAQGASVNTHFFYRDHKSYEIKDFEKIVASFKCIDGENEVIILTTEKDYYRLKDVEWLVQFKAYPFYYICIEMQWWMHELSVQSSVKAITRAE